MTSQHRHSSYIGLVAVLVAVAMAVVAIANLIADPYGVLSSLYKTDYRTPQIYARIAKPYAVRAIQPSVVALGTSRAAAGIALDPADWNGARVYNMAFGGQSAYETIRQFQHAVAVGEVSDAVLLLDFEAFLGGHWPKEGFSEERLAVDWSGISQRYPLKELAELMFSGESFLRSLFLSSVFNKNVDSFGTSDPAIHAEPLKKHGYAKEYQLDAYKRAQVQLHGQAPGCSRVQLTSMQALAELFALADRSGVRVWTGLSPVHVSRLHVYRRIGWWHAYAMWKSEVARIHSVSRQRARAIVDFAAPSALTTQSIVGSDPDSSPMHFYDGSHFTVDVGRHIIERLRNPRRADDFGVVLTPDLAATQHREIDGAVTDWALENEQDVALFEVIPAADPILMDRDSMRAWSQCKPRGE